MAKKPEAIIKVGKVQIVVWKNSGEKYDTLSFSLTKNYKDKKGEWQTTSSFSMSDLADADIAIRRAQDMFRVGNVEDNREDTNSGDDQGY